MLRTIIESEEFVQQKNEIYSDTKYLDKILLGVTFVISRDPKTGYLTGIKNIWGITTDDPSLVIYYSFNEGQVDLLGIRLGEKLEDGADVLYQGNAEIAPGDERKN